MVANPESSKLFCLGGAKPTYNTVGEEVAAGESRVGWGNGNTVKNSGWVSP